MIIIKPSALTLAICSIISLGVISCNSANIKTSEKTATPQANSKASIVAIPAWRKAASHTLTRGAKDAIFPAAKNGDLPKLKKLIAGGIEVNYRNFNGETVLHIAASRGNLAMVQYLLTQGADINAMTGKKWQPIHHAMRFEHATVANYLIAHKASLQTKTSDGLTALELAKASQNSAIKSIIATRSR